jgi:hypothetical protein
MSRKTRVSEVAKEGRTAVRIAGEGEEQSPLEGREVTLDYLFAPGIRQEHPHRTCRTSQTSAHPSRSLSLGFLIWTRLLIRNAGPGHRSLDSDRRMEM